MEPGTGYQDSVQDGCCGAEERWVNVEILKYYMNMDTDMDAEGPAFFSWIPKLFGKRIIVTVHGECEIIWTTREKPDFMRVCAA